MFQTSASKFLDTMTADEIIENDLIKSEFIEHVDKIYFDVDRMKLIEIAIRKIDIDKE
jgi:hypothetical protein